MSDLSHTGLQSGPKEETMTYDNDNVFAKILRGELPAHKAFEDSDTLVIMDIMPRLPGHCLVIPKTPCRNILDASPEQLNACMATTQKVARAAMTAFGAPGVTVQQFNESAGGQVVFHLHFHILPRHDGIPIGPHTGQMEDDAVLAANAEKIKKALK